MEYTGIAGQILSWAILITAYAVVVLGLILLWCWIFDLVVNKVFTYLKLKKRFIQFLFDKEREKAERDS